MRINHNLASLNTYRQLSSNSANSQNSLEKLSSGLRINKAGDDAAGLAISEKMRAQIKGLDQASRNSQDGISMIQTAEGALNETHSILQRMRELATQSANDTNVDVDREEIQKEMNQLTSEINRIGNTTEFNTQKLLDGGGSDPTTSATVSSNGLEVPSTLQGGSGAANALSGATANTAFTMAAATASTDDAKGMEIKIGDRELTIKYDSDTTADSIDGDTITIGISGDLTAAQSADAIEAQLNTVINADENLTGDYTVANDGAGKLTITAGEVAVSTSGTLTGALDGGVSNAYDTDTITTGVTNDEAEPASHANETIDFTDATVEDLKGSEIIIDSKRIAFYDSADGAYDGANSDDADFAIDLNGARTAEKIVDKIVDAMSGTAAATVSASVSGDDVFDAQNSALGDVYLTKVDSTKLQITAQQAGAQGNLEEMGNNAEVEVLETYGNSRLDNEGVVVANGLADGEHKVSVEYVAGSATESDLGATQTAGDISAIAVDNTSTLESGTYRILFSVADTSVKIQKQGDDGSWADEGTTSVATTADGAQTLDFDNGLTVTTAAAFLSADYTDANDYTEFTIDAKHFEATLTEAGSDDTAGTAVRVNNGEMNVKLTAEDGIGSAVVNVGGWDDDSISVGDTISWDFKTQAASDDEEEVIGGTFTAKFQIGANNGQSFQMDITDMRSRALEVSGNEAGAKAGGVEGAVYAEIKDVTNGTDNDQSEYALDVSTHDKATSAIEVINNAIESVSGQRSQLGAYQNRLEHTINNLGASSENLTAAESRVRDVDMAKEMIEFTKNNILTQAAQTMMAQANQQPQGVLSLLR